MSESREKELQAEKVFKPEDRGKRDVSKCDCECGTEQSFKHDKGYNSVYRHNIG